MRANFSWSFLYYSRPACFSEYFLFLVDYILINTWIQTQLCMRKPLLVIPFVIADLIHSTYFLTFPNYISVLYVFYLNNLKIILSKTNIGFRTFYVHPNILSTKRSYTSTIVCYYNRDETI